MHQIILPAFLALTASAAYAQNPSPVAAPVPVPSPPPASAPATAAILGPPPSLLDSLVGKAEIVGITKQDGTRYLCHLNAGDHGLYVAQTFHFAGPPQVKTRKETTAAKRVAHTSSAYVSSGRGLRRVRVTTYSMAPAKTRTVKDKTDTTIPDDRAVRLLLAGVAGSIRDPREVMGTRDLFSASDVKYLQTLSPPVKPAAKSAANPFLPAAASRPNWTMTMLWPADQNTLNAEKKAAHKKGKRRGQ